MLFRREKNVKYKSWHGLLLLVVVLAALALGIYQRFNPRVDRAEVDNAYLNEQTCTASGGNWNDCGSACRGQDVAVCVQVCVAMCECQNDNQCPYGFSCGEVIDGVGVCSKL